LGVGGGGVANRGKAARVVYVTNFPRVWNASPILRSFSTDRTCALPADRTPPRRRGVMHDDTLAVRQHMKVFSLFSHGCPLLDTMAPSFSPPMPVASLLAHIPPTSICMPPMSLCLLSPTESQSQRDRNSPTWREKGADKVFESTRPCLLNYRTSCNTLPRFLNSDRCRKGQCRPGVSWAVGLRQTQNEHKSHPKLTCMWPSRGQRHGSAPGGHAAA